MEPKVRKSGDCICKAPQSCGLGFTETAPSKGFPDISVGSIGTLSQLPEMSRGKEKIFQLDLFTQKNRERFAQL